MNPNSTVEPLPLRDEIVLWILNRPYEEAADQIIALFKTSQTQEKERIISELEGLKKELRNYDPDKDLTEPHHTQIMVQNMANNEALDQAIKLIKENRI